MNRAANRKLKKNKHPKSVNTKFIKFFICFLFFSLLIIIFYYLTPSQISNNQKITLFGKNLSYDSHIIIIDQNKYSITRIIIPNNTQVDSAYELGKWKLESVWKLSLQEQIGDTLIKNTLIKTFGFPVLSSVNSNIDHFSKNYPISLLTYLIKGSDYNYKDRLFIIKLILTTPESSITTINLADTPALKSTQLIGGDEGYVFTGNTPLSLTKLFSQPVFFEDMLNIKLVNQSDSNYPNQLLTKVIETLGAKIISIDNSDSANFNCLVKSSDPAISHFLATLFECEKVKKTDDSSFDAEIILGKDFLKRF